jgi:predicted ArsR family transcriptional regulator
VSSERDLERIAALQDPVRRKLFVFVREQGRPVGREEASGAAGIGRSLAAYHLDHLGDDGLLTVSYARAEGRGGPGAGRPAKLYEPAAGEVVVSVPARDYEFLARLLARAAEADPSGTARAALDDVAREQGRELGASLAGRARRTGLERALRERGYEPFRDEEGVVRMRNCPFHRLAADHRDLVCGMNLAFLGGLIDGLGRNEVEGALEPAPGRCCVAIRQREP